MDHNSGRVCYETYLSTQQPQTQADPWFSSPYGNKERPTDLKPQAREGSSPVDAVTRPGDIDRAADAPQGFSRARRLTRPEEFSRVFANPLRSSDGLFTVVARDNGGSTARLGLAISKRVAKRAVQRNRIKRVAREVFRLQRNLPSLDFVVLAGAGASRVSRTELRASLERHIERLVQRTEPNTRG